MAATGATLYHYAGHQLTEGLAASGVGSMVLASRLDMAMHAALGISLRDVYTLANTAVLPAAGDATSLGFVPGVHGTNTPKIVSSNATAAGVVTETARFQCVLPILPADLYLLIRAAVSAVPDQDGKLVVGVREIDGIGSQGAELCLGYVGIVDPYALVAAATGLSWTDATQLPTAQNWRAFRVSTANMVGPNQACLDVLITNALHNHAGACALTLGKIAWVFAQKSAEA